MSDFDITDYIAFSGWIDRYELEGAVDTLEEAIDNTYPNDEDFDQQDDRKSAVEELKNVIDKMGSADYLISDDDIDDHIQNGNRDNYSYDERYENYIDWDAMVSDEKEDWSRVELFGEYYWYEDY